MWQSARPIETAPHHTYQERPLLLWCPEQGAWQTGMWFNGRWMDSFTLSHPLAPTFWTEIPPPPLPISPSMCGTGTNPLDRAARDNIQEVGARDTQGAS